VTIWPVWLCTSPHEWREWPAQVKWVVSKTLADLVLGSGLGFDDRGTHELKGVPGFWPLVALRNEPPRAMTTSG
jgi:hypothetical protein